MRILKQEKQEITSALLNESKAALDCYNEIQMLPAKNEAWLSANPSNLVKVEEDPSTQIQDVPASTLSPLKPRREGDKDLAVKKSAKR